MMHSKRDLPDIEQRSRAVAPTSSRDGPVLAYLASGLTLLSAQMRQSRPDYGRDLSRFQAKVFKTFLAAPSSFRSGQRWRFGGFDVRSGRRDGAGRVCALNPHVRPETKRGASIFPDLFAGLITFGCICFALRRGTALSNE